MAPGRPMNSASVISDASTPRAISSLRRRPATERAVAPSTSGLRMTMKRNCPDLIDALERLDALQLSVDSATLVASGRRFTFTSQLDERRSSGDDGASERPALRPKPVPSVHSLEDDPQAPTKPETQTPRNTAATASHLLLPGRCVRRESIMTATRLYPAPKRLATGFTLGRPDDAPAIRDCARPGRTSPDSARFGVERGSDGWEGVRGAPTCGAGA